MYGKEGVKDKEKLFMRHGSDSLPNAGS